MRRLRRHGWLLFCLVIGSGISWLVWRWSGVVPRYSGHPAEPELQRFVDDPGLAARRCVHARWNGSELEVFDLYTDRVLNRLKDWGPIQIARTNHPYQDWGGKLCLEITSGMQSKLELWDFGTSTFVPIHVVSDSAKYVRYFPTFHRLLVHDQDVYLYDTSDKIRLLAKLPMSGGWMDDRFVGSRYFVVPGESKQGSSFLVYDLVTGGRLVDVPDVESYFLTELFDRSGRLLVISHNSGKVECWDLQVRRRLWVDEPAGGGSRATQLILDDGSACVVYAHNTKEYQLIDLGTGSVLRRWQPRYRYDHPRMSAPQGKRIYSVVGLDTEQDSWEWWVAVVKWVKQQLKVEHVRMQNWPRIDDFDTGESFDYRGVSPKSQTVGMTADGQYLVLERPGPVWDIYTIPGDRPWVRTVGIGAGVAVGLRALRWAWCGFRRWCGKTASSAA